MNRREFLMSTLAVFALSALPKLTLAEAVAVSDAVKAKIDPKNKLGFGFMRLPLKNPDDQTAIDYDVLNKMVDTFLERGFTYFDTAWMYMGYESEVAIRKSLVERHPRNKFTVASKLPVGYLKSHEEQEQIFNKQLTVVIRAVSISKRGFTQAQRFNLRTTQFKPGHKSFFNGIIKRSAAINSHLPRSNKIRFFYFFSHDKPLLKRKRI